MEHICAICARLDHVDEVLRTAQLASYFHSRTVSLYYRLVLV
jgi:hypothetical protein